MSLEQQHIILFYKYHPLSSDRLVTEEYRALLEQLCKFLQLRGRILVGCSRSEGINGTLAGTYHNVLAFTYALLGSTCSREKLLHLPATEKDSAVAAAVEGFWKGSAAFFERIGEVELLISRPEDFKWSTASSTSPTEPLFPDLNIKLVSELIGTGGVLSSISLDETAQGYLTPAQWHEEMALLNKSSNDNDTILIDCRNTKEHQIGHFVHAVDPKTTAFSQFPKWVDDHKHLLANKKIRMFCTGGIRCEKASAYIRRQVPTAKDVKHLQGGIHKYLEQYGSAGHYKGKNFLFDVRGAASGEETRLRKDPTAQADAHDLAVTAAETATVQVVSEIQDNDDNGVVGRCVDCLRPYDQFDPHCVCTVCREPTLVCLKCQEHLWEYHCLQHSHLKTCYFSDLTPLTDSELESQLQELQRKIDAIAVGRRFRQKRKTLQKQIARVHARLEECAQSDSQVKPIGSVGQRHCRNCGDINCSGRCWGFFGLKRKEILEKQHTEGGGDPHSVRTTCNGQPKAQPPTSKRPRREQMIEDMKDLQMFMPPSAYRDPVTGIRVPPCMTRLLQCSTKAKWCGESVIHVIQNEFAELGRPEVLQNVLANGLLRVNQRVVTVIEASDMQLKSSDTIARVVHWHEAPVLVPAHIQVTKVMLPDSVIDAYGMERKDDPCIYVCNKPSTVPVHQAGPYFANCLTVMVEAQEKFEPQTLSPLHRTDRVTSGLTLCTTNTMVSRLLHKHLTEGRVQKLYVARVKGRFPESCPLDKTKLVNTEITCTWIPGRKVLCIDAPIHTIDAANGIRTVAPAGKSAQSHFKLLDYDEKSDTSILLCSPITGRNHQLRVHLQSMGFAIVGDVLYGAEGDNSLSNSVTEQSVVDLMLKRVAEDEECKLSCLSESDVTAAKRACPCCTGGRSGLFASFTAAQLLKQGHAIQLHALRYRVNVVPPKKKTPKQSEGIEPEEPSLALIDFEVNVPDWVEDRVSKSDLCWLD